MALIQQVLLAQFSINFATDSLVGESFGMDNASFSVVLANTTYSIDFDDDSAAVDAQRQVSHSLGGTVVLSDGPLLVAANVGPPEGLTITSTAVATGLPAASANIYRFSVWRQGVVS